MPQLDVEISLAARQATRIIQVYMTRQPEVHACRPETDFAARQRRFSRMDEFVTVANVGSIQEGQGGTFKVGEHLVAVFVHNGEYFAIDDLCPHMGASLGAGEVDQLGAVTCPWHAWRFSVKDGTWCDNPRLKIAAHEVRVVDDQIQVRVCDQKGDSNSP
ncbi:Rieske (2Fe-2S) protein [Pirellulales bacterium]|nr:Rieske (2Fe-2S) protein [Pirellulales bacterium]